MASSIRYVRDLKETVGLDGISEDILEVEIESVNIHKESKTLRVKLNSGKLVLDEDLDRLTSALKRKLSKFDFLSAEISYDFPLEDHFEGYIKNLCSLIKAEIPSSCGWIEGLVISLCGSKITLKTPNELAIARMKLAEISCKIKEKVQSEFGIDVLVEFGKVDQEENPEDYNKRKEAEEQSILERISRGIDASPKSEKQSSATGETGKKSGFTQADNRKKSRALVKKISGERTAISDINIHSGAVITEGEVFDLEKKEIKGNKKIYIFNLTDFKSSVNMKMFVSESQEEEVGSVISNGNYIRVQGDAMYDTFSRQLSVMLKSAEKLARAVRKDESTEKRVELHCHTKMSSMDGVASASSLVKRAIEWGHKAIAITDHGVVQGFPEAMYESGGKDIKVIYGLEGYLVDDGKGVVESPGNRNLNTDYVVFDIETTGFSPRNDSIIEIGAVKIEQGNVVSEFSELIDPKRSLPDKIVELTGITDQMLAGKMEIDQVLPKFLEFAGDSVLVAHNAQFDMSFIRTKARELLGAEVKNTVLDTLSLARAVYPRLKNHKLNTVAKHVGASLENHHRAVDDSRATAQILLKLLEPATESGVETLEGLNEYSLKHRDLRKERSNHIIIYAKDYTGLKNLYKIVSSSHMDHFYRKPRIPRSTLCKFREGLILGTACESGELYGAILKNRPEEEIERIVDFYDFLEIQPIGNNMFLARNGDVSGEEELMDINRKIVELGEKSGKLVVATGDVHFLEPEDEVYRRILMAGQGFSDADDQAPLYFRTTEEMMAEFEYLGPEKCKEVVVENTNRLADMVEDLKPIPDGTYPPEIEGADEELREMNYKKAIGIYGDPLPEIVKDRLDRELNSIISNGYAVLYIISQKLVTKSLRDGYLVGSRGSVGSSLVATMSDITEVNPLPPHYICTECKYSEFVLDGSVGSGVDLEDKTCPKCGIELVKEGHDIPFEVFLGFEGDKEPDIDLNFAGEYQPVAHKYTEELFGRGYVFRAGTIGTVAEKTAYGFVRKYYESKGEDVSGAEISRLVKGCTGIKRTSGQHPGGVMVVPSYKDVFDFTPIQYPADDDSSGVVTTHFDYNAISGRILKLDILGHDVPSIIRMLEDITGVKPEKAPLDDPETKKLFLSTESLGVEPEEIKSEVGTLGIPEFGTKFVRQMLVDTRPTTFSELVRISGLSHGTDVWINNAHELVKAGIAKLNEVICTRDDIMNYLIYSGLDKKKSFKMMEKVRKGKGLTDEEEAYMRENNVPEWYIESCQKIKYMFPKAHAVAYVMMSFRIAYFKVHYPEAFYATYFTTKAADFDAELILKGREVVEQKISELEKLGLEKSAKEKNLLTVLEVALEMYARGFTFERVNLYKSDSDKFTLGEKGILPPLKSLEGVGENAARSIVKERSDGDFISIEDMVIRAKVSKTVVEALRLHGCLDGMPETNQLNLFTI
ncbi:DNA polymerase III PolC-type [Andreesenia angusta]|uniref:DNA polymerase III PolC-type n=1 Tax=Andreesenia angusta TaxID=39480 RepID=A0A1S1V878_9FIRM|nr:PolC-type DNA polymerase III [Andreesenia angusta]OHW62798.1 DNA polymerase III PolC-type [Andreesenia angusta]